MPFRAQFPSPTRGEGWTYIDRHNEVVEHIYYNFMQQTHHIKYKLQGNPNEKITTLAFTFCVC